MVASDNTLLSTNTTIYKSKTSNLPYLTLKVLFKTIIFTAKGVGLEGTSLLMFPSVVVDPEYIRRVLLKGRRDWTLVEWTFQNIVFERLGLRLRPQDTKSVDVNL